MSYAKKNLKSLTASIVGMVVFATLAAWQFYQFVVTESTGGGTGHLWWAIALAVLACGLGFMVFFVFVRHDTDDDLHITGHANRI
jgi:hypothetical protein